MASPVLDLGTLNPTRPHILIDGVPYRMKVPMDIDLRTISRLTQIDQLLAPKAETPKPSAKLLKEFSDAVDEGVRLIMYDPIPPRIMSKLNEFAKLGIIEAFPLATKRARSRPNRAARRAAAKRKPTRSTSRASSPA